MSRNIPTVCVFLAALTCVVLASFDCRRRGQTCLNGGSCPDINANCTCISGFGGYDCSYNTSLVGIGACNRTECENGGTCVETVVNVTSCLCPPEFYGDKCSFKRYQVTCKSGSLLVGINPHGNFSGYIYVENKRDTCKFDKADSSANATKGWEGYAKDVGNKEVNCTVINPLVDPPTPVNGTAPSNQTTSYTRVVYVVYEKTFVTSLDEVLTFTCIFNTDSVFIDQQTVGEPLEAKNLNEKTTTATLSPVKFGITTEAGESATRGKKVTLGQTLVMSFQVDSTSFDGARLESCIFNDTIKVGGDKLVVVEKSCVNEDAKSILKDPIQYDDDNATITIAMKIRVFKFVNSNKLGISCKVKACPLGQGDNCSPRDCKNEIGNQQGYGRRRREAQMEDETMEVGSVLVVEYTSKPEETDTVPTTQDKKPTPSPQCSIAKEVTAILAALGTVTLILLIVTIVLMSRAVITSPNSKAKAKEERSDTYSNLGQPKAFTRKY